MQQDPLGEPRILYEDEHVLVASKPNRLLVHRTEMDYYERRNLLRWLGEVREGSFYPAHRLDKATSGVIVFAKDKESLQHLRIQFNERSVGKEYLALVRGYTAAEGTIEKAIRGEEDPRLKTATTHYETLFHVEVPIAVSRYDSSRYSIVRVQPETGRYHQIRLHFAHLRHPVVGDTRHGDLRHNHMFRDLLGLEALFLHAETLSFMHPAGRRLELSAPLPAHFKAIQSKWDWVAGSGVDDSSVL